MRQSGDIVLTLRTLVSAGFLSMLAPVAAIADEAWTTSFGDVIYETDIGDTAIFLLQNSEVPGRMYFPGLAGSLEDRGSHLGYWIGQGEGFCDASLTGIDGMTSKNWGSVMLTFDRPTFPTAWTAVLGECFDKIERAVRAEIR